MAEQNVGGGWGGGRLLKVRELLRTFDANSNLAGLTYSMRGKSLK